MNKDIIVSGIRSTGFLHLGNYFGAIHNYLKMQNEYNCYFFVADLHSLTTHPNPKELRESVLRVTAEYLASGLDPEQACLYAQSDIPEISELYLLLNMLAYKGELEKVPTFKDKVRLSPQNVNAGLLTYPVLMAADILIHRANKVPVGKDQEQHLEMARNFAQRFNHRYEIDLFPEPQVFRFADEGVKILGLDGNGKMSKSENENATIYLNDSDELIEKKIKRAQTDSGPDVADATPPDYIENLFSLMKLSGHSDMSDKYRKDYAEMNIRYGDMKKDLAQAMISFVKPIREKTTELLKDKSHIAQILKAGAEKARESAQKTLLEARTAIGINYH